MSAIRHLARGAVVGGVLLATGLAAAPALAAEASARLGRLPSRMTVGGTAVPLVGAVTNTSRQPLGEVRVVFVIRMSGLDPEEVSLSGLQLTADDGRLRAAEEIEAPAPRRSTAVGHQLQFLPGAPSGQATVTMEVYINRDGQWRRVDTASTSTSVRAARGTPTASPTESPAPSEPAAAVSAAPVGAGQGPPPADRDPALWPLYVLGLLLVAGGGGLVALLLLRRSRGTDDELAYAPGYPPGYPSGYPPGYPSQAGQPYGGPAPTWSQRPAAYPEPPPPVQPEAPTVIMPAIPETPPDPRGYRDGYGRHRPHG